MCDRKLYLISPLRVASTSYHEGELTRPFGFCYIILLMNLITPQATPIGVQEKKQTMTKQQKAIVDLLLVEPHLKCREVAERIGCHFTSVSKTLSKQHVREYLLAGVNTELLLSAPAAMATMKKLLGSKSDYIKLHSASDLLNRNEVGSVGIAIGQAVQVNIDLS